MNSLDTKLRALASDGELTYLSICPVAGKGGIEFSASYSPSSTWGSSMERDPDPVVACLKAIESYKGARPPKRVKAEPAPIPAPEPDEFGL